MGSFKFLVEPTDFYLYSAAADQVGFEADTVTIRRTVVYEREGFTGRGEAYAGWHVLQDAGEGMKSWTWRVFGMSTSIRVVPNLRTQMKGAGLLQIIDQELSDEVLFEVGWWTRSTEFRPEASDWAPLALSRMRGWT